MIQTRVFELAAQAGWTDLELSIRMGISAAQVSRVRNDVKGIGAAFIRGAKRAFPGKTLDELFIVEDEPAGVC